ncbi:DUF3526 domain-containing protein [Pedobacter lithocola]|uniref:DUF3526 domain-containing protein n=1 Tax=Pedobacter lithocola TaxID=1908239 RepID=A0ABV8PE67_9SPHI
MKIWLLIRHQYKEWHLNKLLYVFIGSIACLWIFCLFTGLNEYKAVAKTRQIAQHNDREQWLNQGDKHPHIAAHFGNFAFKPINVLSIFDKGIDAYSGTYIYLEAHRQNDFLLSPAQSSSSLIRFGELNVALLLQLLVPLLLIILSFNSIISERLSGTLTLIKVTGISGHQMVVAKILSPLMLALSTIVVLYAISFVLFYFSDIRFTSEDLVKTSLILIAYGCYYFIFLTVTISIATFSKTLKQSLIISLSVWIFACVVSPKLLANFSSAIYTLPSNTAFKEAVRNDIINGMDGHNTSDIRAKKFTADLLKKHKVDSTSQLPVNIEGLVMMEGEKYSSKVYNNHFDSLSNALQKQQNIFTYASFLNPLLSIKNLSIGLSNTDLSNEIAFRKDAEIYRMQFVQAMNEDMAKNSKEGDFNTYKTGKKLFSHIPDFAYKNADTLKVFKNHLLDFIALIFLMLVSVILIKITAQKI